MRTRALALASEALVEEVAARELVQSKSAVAAVIAGFFAAAGTYPDVLLGPSTLLVAGVGSGGRAFDGRLRQPGLGTKRPRGFRDTESVPNAARVALPSSIAAFAVALAYDRVTTLSKIAKAGVQAAREASALERVKVLQRIAEVGPRALEEGPFMRPLLHVASPSEGGLLTPADFGANGDFTAAASERSQRGETVLEAPWSSDKPVGLAPNLVEGVCAVDARGVYAVLGYARIGDGMEVAPLELVAALGATPVERGTPRVRPGEPIACSAPFRITCDVGGAPREVSLGARALKRSHALKIARTEGRWVQASR